MDDKRSALAASADSQYVEATLVHDVIPVHEQHDDDPMLDLHQQMHEITEVVADSRTFQAHSESVSYETQSIQRADGSTNEGRPPVLPVVPSGPGLTLGIVDPQQVHQPLQSDATKFAENAPIKQLTRIRRSKWLIVGAAVLLVLIIIGVVVGKVVSGGDDPPNVSGNVSPPLNELPQTSPPTTPPPTASPTTLPPTTLPTLPPTTLPPTTLPTLPPTTLPPTTPAPTTQPNTRLCSDDFGSQQDGYQICLDLNVPSEDVSYFEEARNIWTRVIAEDVPSVSSVAINTSYACSYYPDNIDDIYICGQYQDMDGVGGTVATAHSPIYAVASGLPCVGVVEFDSSDVSSLKEQGRFHTLVAWAFGVSLGFQSHVWEPTGLLSSSECRFLGTNATREWQSLSSCTTNVPLDRDETSCKPFWNDTCFGDELMTNYASADIKISRVTIGALNDLGYGVDYSQGDNFTTSDLNPICVCSSAYDSNRARMLRTSSNVEEISNTEVFPTAAHSKHRQLSYEGYVAAWEHGLRHLEEMHTRHLSSSTFLDESIRFVGDQSVTIFYQEDDHIYAVQVSR